MRAAAPKTYISRRMLDKYSEQRLQQQQSKQSSASAKSAAPLVPPKAFSEDGNKNTSEAAQASSQLPAIEEDKQELENTNAQVINQDQAAAEENKNDQQQPQLEAQVKKGFFNSIANMFSKKKTDPQPQPQQQQQVQSQSKKKRQNSIDRNLSADEMDSDELDGDLNLSDEDESGAVRGNLRSRMPNEQKEERERIEVEFDTNIFKVSLDCLQDRGQLATGDAEFCSTCKGVFNKTSVIVTEEEKQIWSCEFCNTRNEVHIEAEEVPQSNELTYLLEAAAQIENAEEEKKDTEGENKSDKISVVFCIDISGSMSTGGRLNLCKQAVAGQINAMASSNGDRKLGLVAFDHEVEIIGDGIEKPHVIKDMGTLQSYDQLLSNGHEQADVRMNKPISETKDALQNRVAAMNTKGRTALGPAVLTSVAMASKGAPGSQVIICTDGMANVGIGAFSNYGHMSFANADDPAAEFYDKVGQLAEQTGVMINLVTIAGTDANIQGLSRLIELSGGQIEQVNPAELNGDFANILSQKAIATKVEAKVKLHKGLQFRNELQTDLSEDKTILTRRFGNVTTDSMFTFEYGMKPISQLLAIEDLNMATITHLPFQTQITYTALNGDKCLRVITQKLEVSNERDELTAQADAEMVQQNVLMQGSKQARAGNTRQAQAIMKNFQRKTKNVTTGAWQSNRADFQAQCSEAYSAMNMQVMSSKMPQQQQVRSMPVQQKQRKSKMQSLGAPQQMMAQQQMQDPAMFMQQMNQLSAAQPQQQQMSSMSMNMKSSVRQDDRFASQMYQMSTKAKRSKY